MGLSCLGRWEATLAEQPCCLVDRRPQVQTSNTSHHRSRIRKPQANNPILLASLLATSWVLNPRSGRCRTTVSRRQLASRPFSQAAISRAHCSRRLMRGESSGSVSRDFNIYVEASRSSALGPTVIIPEGSLGDSAGFRAGGREGSVPGDSQGIILLASSLREPRRPISFRLDSGYSLLRAAGNGSPA